MLVGCTPVLHEGAPRANLHTLTIYESYRLVVSSIRMGLHGCDGGVEGGGGTAGGANGGGDGGGDNGGGVAP